MAEGNSSIDRPDEKEVINNESLTCTPVSVQEANEQSTHDVENTLPEYLNGWRLHLLTTALCFSIFLSALDITIVSTSLVSITNDLKAFDKSSWIVSSYLITYFSFLIIWAKLSDIFGRKIFLNIAIILFLIASGVCGAAQAVPQLIVFRAFQGIGGAGIFAMAPVIISEMVPPAKFGGYNALASSTIGISFLLGPLVGGAINNSQNLWRWIFLINIPVGVVALVFTLVAMPSNFPRQASPLQRSHPFVKSTLRRIDFPGFLLFLAACLLLVCALEEAGTAYEWSSGLIIAFLTLSGVLYIAFFVWQRIISSQETTREPVFPWKFVHNRVLMGIFLNALLSGVPYTAVIIELPQRFQTVNDASPLNAGVRLLPFSLPCAIASALTGAFTSGLKIPPFFVIFAGGILQTLGLAIAYTLPLGLHIPASQYGSEALVGFGVGLSLTTLLGFIPFVVEKSDRAIALGGVTQLRVLGGTVGVAIATNLLNNHIKNSLSSVLRSDQLDAVLRSTQVIGTLEPTLQAHVKTVFAEGYNMGTGAMLGFAAAEFLSVLLMWEKKHTRTA